MPIAPFSWQDDASEVHTRAALDALRELHRTSPVRWIPAFDDTALTLALDREYRPAWSPTPRASM
ncbi:MAG: hypothetical protein QF515_07925 [Pseudomonadales bacterium]|nr:hypothetical protein [Pseudomonadales bacterium]MDP6827026.1 hypothetical protein [Pseudomonadales bacterium]